jgi:polar amino acid transport system substrate-binding protein
LKVINYRLRIISAVTLCFLFNTQVIAENISLWGNYKKAPKIYLDKDKNPKGILIDIANLISAETGIQFSYKFAPWARTYQQSLYAKNKNTGIIGIKKNQERLQLFDFSAPVFHDSNYLVVLKNRKLNINHIKGLKNLKIGYNRKAYYGKKFEAAKKYFITAEDTNNIQRLKKLLVGRIDAALLGGPGNNGLNMAITQDKTLQENKDKFVLLPLEFTTADHIAFAKNLNQQDTLNRINKAIKKLKKEGKIQKIISKYSH